MNGIDFLFYVLAFLTVVSGLIVIAARNPIYSALALVVTIFSLAAFYLMLYAEFLAIVQALTYAGAILVLFIFIIMLLNLQPGELIEKSYGLWGKSLLAFVSLLVFVALGSLTYFYKIPTSGLTIQFGSIKNVGRRLFTEHLLSFELAGVLLTVALIGAVVLAKKDLSLKKEKTS